MPAPRSRATSGYLLPFPCGAISAPRTACSRPATRPGDGWRSNQATPAVGRTIPEIRSASEIASPASVGAGPLDGPDRRHVADIPTYGLLCAEHEPDRHVSTGIAPENITLAVAVEVAGAGDLPDIKRRISNPR